MEHPENIFQAARVPPPKSKQIPPKSTYVREGQDYPSFRFHETNGSRIVQNADEDLAASEAGWVSTPFEAAPPVPPEPTGRENAAAWKAMADRLTAENERLTEDNMRLKNQVEDSQNVALIADLKDKLAISERARSGLQKTLDAREAAKARFTAEKAKDAVGLAPVAVEEPERGDDLMQLIRQHGGEAAAAPEE